MEVFYIMQICFGEIDNDGSPASNRSSILGRDEGSFASTCSVRSLIYSSTHLANDIIIDFQYIYGINK